MFTESLVNLGSDVVRSMEKHSPEICLGVGIVSMVAATVMASKNSIKAKKAIEQAEEDFETIAQTEELGYTYDDDNNKVEYTHNDSIKDKTIVTANVGMDLIKSYGPAVVLTVTGIFFLVKGHNILQKRNLALAVAYEGVSKAYRNYQNKIKELLGEETACNLKRTVTEQEIDEEVGKKKDGTPKTKKKKINVIGDTNQFSPYARLYDAGCPGWENDPQLNLTILKGRQSYWNDMLNARRDHTVFLNEVYKDLGFAPSEAGQVVGWSLNHDSGDGYIDFGIYNMAYQPNRDFVNGWEPACLLDFNVDDEPVINCLPKYGSREEKNEDSEY